MTTRFLLSALCLLPLVAHGQGILRLNSQLRPTGYETNLWASNAWAIAYSIPPGSLETNQISPQFHALLGGGASLLSSTNVWTSPQTFSNNVVIAPGVTFTADVMNVGQLNVSSIDGAAVTSGVNADNISTGTLPAARIGVGSLSTNKVDGPFYELLTTPSGGGGTKTVANLLPIDYQPPVTNWATLGERNAINVLQFSDTVEWSADWVRTIPEAAVLTSGLTYNIDWVASAATSGSVRWCVQVDQLTNLSSESFDTAACVTSAADATNGVISRATITITTIDSVAAGNPARHRIYRDHDHGDDDMSGLAQMVITEIRTAN